MITGTSPAFSSTSCTSPSKLRMRPRTSSWTTWRSVRARSEGEVPKTHVTENGSPRRTRRPRQRRHTISSPADWRALVEAPGPGDHILFWTTDSPLSDSILRAFVQGGLERRDLVAVLWPRSEHKDLHRRFQAMGVSLDFHITRDDLVLLDAEDYRPRDAEDEARISSVWEDLGSLVSSRRRPGLTLLGRVAPSLFESGDTERAEFVERMVRDRHGTARVLCPYRYRDLAMADLAGASRLVRLHSHTITSFGDERPLVESVGDRPRA